MKKTVFILLATLIAAGSLPSCNDSDGDYPDFSRIATVHTLGAGDYYFEQDDGQTLYPGDRSRVAAYKPEDRRRAIVWFDRIPGNEASESYTYNIALYAVRDIYTGTSEVVTDPQRLAELADDRTGIPVNYESYSNLTDEWLTLYAIFPGSDLSKHSFRLIVDRTAAPVSGQDEEYLAVELRHDAGGDTAVYRMEDYLSFDLAPLAESFAGKKGIDLRVNTLEHGIMRFRFDFPQGR